MLCTSKTGIEEEDAKKAMKRAREVEARELVSKKRKVLEDAQREVHTINEKLQTLKNLLFLTRNDYLI